VEGKLVRESGPQWGPGAKPGWESGGEVPLKLNINLQITNHAE